MISMLLNHHKHRKLALMYLLAVPRGGKAKLAVGTAWRRKGN